MQPNEPLTGKTVAILAAQEYEDIELLYPLLRLSEAGASIRVGLLKMGFHPRPYLENKPVTGRFGTPFPLPVMPEGRRYHLMEIEAMRPEGIDCLLFPGGFAPDYLRRSPVVLDLTRRCFEQGKVVAAICHAPWVLISAGVLKGRRATGVAAVRDDVVNAGAEWVDAPVVVDGNLVTSRTPNDLPDFCLAIIRILAGQPQPA